MSLNFNLIGKIVNFKARYCDDTNPVLLDGKIEFLREDEYIVYASWRIFDGSNLIVTMSSNFFSKIEDRTNDFVIRQIIKQIEKYRMGRKHVFKCIVLCDNQIM